MTGGEAIPTVFIVRTEQPPALEVFAHVEHAREYARLRSGATVHFLPVRFSLGDAQVVVERRVSILKGQVISDKAVEETLFSAGVDFSIPDIETYQEDMFRWNVVGLGSDRRQVDEGVDMAVARISRAIGVSPATALVVTDDDLPA
ncbi:hypothetical protein FFI94_031900 [Rhodococcus sp. KBS0724]|uniref:hypothetical protein n=1 Tax=Rhodococcus sp. KBS0724 TaxID=1179674 RepID=UPI00110D9F5E|nr:hypothetical protein [Rhodococcus sp. KBS0724]TSD40341.1 hypothetical protein FFI94_031900 [Rhodococcus sp. KBS0724]